MSAIWGHPLPVRLCLVYHLVQQLLEGGGSMGGGQLRAHGFVRVGAGSWSVSGNKRHWW